MGSCQNKGGVVIKSNFIPNKKIQTKVIKHSNDISLDPKLDDMPIWPFECYRGVGVKRMRGYKCNLTIDKLNELREEFWGIRIKQKLIWQTIKQACIMDDIRAEKILQSFRIKTLNGCISDLIDEMKNVYHIPNYCINDPYLVKELNDEIDHEPEEINIKLFDLYSSKTDIIKINEVCKVCELKREYIKLNNYKSNKIKLRFLFGGAELKDENQIFKYKLKEGYTIQVNKIELD